eukprot:gnl/TRDRNA2_/TRDRNA2_145354_c0_seq1.p1 gnl/TRDRNA2_/TRDRNA2_145354_c0~~gnl/TRDRNA2_/TRDRNA2_145354_c0_seq1.p1  ORF type:complete len:405 (-),score=91.99 gnl/TRDRNA2_/TRDRNA2_145354_c0_seq1:109-1302(-)
MYDAGQDALDLARYIKDDRLETVAEDLLAIADSCTGRVSACNEQQEVQPMSDESSAEATLLSTRKGAAASVNNAQSDEESEDDELPGEGQMSPQLTKILKTSGLTTSEIEVLRRHKSPKSVSEFLATVESEEDATTFAFNRGILSKTSRDRFRIAWLNCLDAVEKKSLRHSAQEASLSDVLACSAPGDFRACTDALAHKAGVKLKRDLLPLVLGLVANLCKDDRLVMEKDLAVFETARRTELYKMSLSSDDHIFQEEDEPEQDVEAAAREALVDYAEWRWNWMVRHMMPLRVALAMQSQILAAYSSESFRLACESLSRDWSKRSSGRLLLLKDKMMQIDALCLERVLSQILPRFGFAASQDGVDRMKSVINRYRRLDAEVDRLQMLIGKAVMANFHP